MQCASVGVPLPFFFCRRRGAKIVARTKRSEIRERHQSRSVVRSVIEPKSGPTAGFRHDAIGLRRNFDSGVGKTRARRRRGNGSACPLCANRGARLTGGGRPAQNACSITGIINEHRTKAGCVWRFARLDEGARGRRGIAADRRRGRLEYRAPHHRAAGAGRRHRAGAAVQQYPRLRRQCPLPPGVHRRAVERAPHRHDAGAAARHA